MEPSELRQRLIEWLGPIVQDHGAELVDLELVGAVNRQTLRLVIHREGGVTVALCEAISREISDFLDVEDPIPGRYRLEVTSPGLDRPLRTDGDFARACSRRLKVVLFSGKAVFGRLVEWDGESIELEGEEGRQWIRRQEIAKATIDVEL